MKKYLTYISEFHENNLKEIEFVNNHLKKHLETNDENQTEIETILDYLYSNPKVDISKIGYTTILEKTEKWHKKLQSVSTKDNEKEGEDYEVFMDFGDGFRIVKLLSKSCYDREGKLMSHCVASYYERNSKIYSLRDSKNLPHCTIEDGKQIKGKGNGKIDPKYIDYIVRFLEKTGMTVGENEMKNLGYLKIDKLKEDLGIDFHDSTKKLLYNGIYYPTHKGTENLLDSEGKEIKHLALLDYFPMFKEEENGGGLKIAIDIAGLTNGFIEFMKNTEIEGVHKKDNFYVGGHYSIMSGGGSSKMSGGDSAKMSGGYSSIMSGGDSSKMSGGDHSQILGGNYAKMSGGNFAKMSGGNYAQMSGGNYAQMSGGHSSIMSGGHSSIMSGGGSSIMSGGGSSIMSGGHYAQMLGGHYAQMLGGESSQMSGGNSSIMSGGNHSMIMASTKSKVKGKIGTLIVIANRRDIFPYDIIEYKAGLVDGINLKEDTWYTLKNGEFTETE